MSGELLQANAGRRAVVLLSHQGRVPAWQAANRTGLLGPNARQEAENFLIGIIRQLPLSPIIGPILPVRGVWVAPVARPADPGVPGEADGGPAVLPGGRPLVAQPRPGAHQPVQGGHVVVKIVKQQHVLVRGVQQQSFEGQSQSRW